MSTSSHADPAADELGRAVQAVLDQPPVQVPRKFDESSRQRLRAEAMAQLTALTEGR